MSVDFINIHIQSLEFHKIKKLFTAWLWNPGRRVKSWHSWFSRRQAHLSTQHSVLGGGEATNNGYTRRKMADSGVNGKDNEAATGDVEAPPTYTERDNVNARGDGLPTYHEASANQEPPPSYDSLYGRMKAAKRESDGTVGFLKSFLVIILSTIGFTILLAIFMAVPVSMIVMGSVYLDDCPAERMIPIYLIVAGAFGAAKNLFSLVQRCRKSEQEREEDQKKVNPVEGIVNCFLFGWFIAGCVFIYRTDDRSSVETDPNYCDPTLYWFAFWITTAAYIIMAASCCCVCMVGCIAACFAKKD
ncbi:uncharacterized protein LOC101853426 [Aplysia californica]|uniref:Uncharacterized protein LOC101853426 n=1 Tax=Aplysia californica TaxID=6500 RepID=A0ABM0K9J4_APLCA|nr:uncharacterized protein LOC101853426 [Aplysia californica]